MMTRQLPIIAIATAPGKAGVGVVRISGKNLAAIIQALFQKALQPRQASLCTLRDAEGQIIDQLISIYFSAPASFTGEDVLELQCHGGPQLLELVMRRCLELGKNEGLVIAEPGEFSLRAYLNNKIEDITNLDVRFIMASSEITPNNENIIGINFYVMNEE